MQELWATRQRVKEKKEESNTVEKKEDVRGYFTWNLEMERVLAEALRDQRSLGRQSDGAWKAVELLKVKNQHHWQRNNNNSHKIETNLHRMTANSKSQRLESLLAFMTNPIQL